VAQWVGVELAMQNKEGSRSGHDSNSTGSICCGFDEDLF